MPKHAILGKRVQLKNSVFGLDSYKTLPTDSVNILQLGFRPPMNVTCPHEECQALFGINSCGMVTMKRKVVLNEEGKEVRYFNLSQRLAPNEKVVAVTKKYLVQICRECDRTFGVEIVAELV